MVLASYRIWWRETSTPKSPKHVDTKVYFLKSKVQNFQKRLCHQNSCFHFFSAHPAFEIRISDFTARPNRYQYRFKEHSNLFTTESFTYVTERECCADCRPRCGPAVPARRRAAGPVPAWRRSDSASRRVRPPISTDASVDDYHSVSSVTLHALTSTVASVADDWLISIEIRPRNSQSEDIITDRVCLQQGE